MYCFVFQNGVCRRGPLRPDSDCVYSTVCTCSSNFHILWASSDCRSEPNLDDLGLAFEDVGVPLHELEDYATQVEQAPFIHQLPWYPKSKANALHHPHNGEVVDRPEYYHDHLPPLIKVLHSNEGSVFSPNLSTCACECV